MKNKRGLGHIEAILAFVLFIGFLIFAFYFFSPFSGGNRLLDSSIDYAFREININTSIDMESYSVVINNDVNLTTGSSSQNSTFGSASNKIIYQVVKNVSSFSPISISANGCDWNIQFEDDTYLNFSVPSNYTGDENCYFNEVPNGEVYNENDALQIAVFGILDELDFNGNSKVDISFTEQDLQISLTQIVGIPFTWSTEVQARVWS